MRFQQQVLSFIISLAVLSGCGGSSDSNNDTDKATFSLSFSDAPVDLLSQINLCFSQIELKGGDQTTTFTVGETIEMLSANTICPDAINTAGINLLDYTGNDAIVVVDNIEVEAGAYTQMRLIMSEGSYAVDANDTAIAPIQIPVTIPSNELKLDGFVVAQGGNVSFTLEFDLRKSMTNPVGQDGYFLKPRGVRLTDNNLTGTLRGTVDEAFLMAEETEGCGLTDLSADTVLASVYIYEGADQPVAPAILGDNTDPDADGELQPLTSTNVHLDTEADTTVYSYTISYITAGNYTVAITCDTSDTPDADEDIVFKTTKNAEIEAGSDTTINFEFP